MDIQENEARMLGSIPGPLKVGDVNLSKTRQYGFVGIAGHFQLP